MACESQRLTTDFVASYMSPRPSFGIRRRLAQTFSKSVTWSPELERHCIDVRCHNTKSSNGGMRRALFIDSETEDESSVSSAEGGETEGCTADSFFSGLLPQGHDLELIQDRAIRHRSRCVDLKKPRLSPLSLDSFSSYASRAEVGCCTWSFNFDADDKDYDSDDDSILSQTSRPPRRSRPPYPPLLPTLCARRSALDFDNGKADVRLPAMPRRRRSIDA